MQKIKIFRRRFIPNEILDISRDEVLFIDDEVLITRWVPIKPREDFNSGKSFTFLKKGYKLSKIFKDNKFIFWYCDIIDVEIDVEKAVYTITDLLVDVKIYPDDTYEILDIDEIGETLLNGTISKEIAALALKRLSDLLEIIYSKSFPPKICMEDAKEQDYENM
jgi:predicted RNA-binding protein associated with RNAse of E/G family